MKSYYLLFYFFLLNTLSAQPVIQWQNNYGGTAGDYVRYAKQTFDSGYIIAGNTFSDDFNVTGQHGNNDAWIVKLNSIGLFEWKYCFGGLDNDGSNIICQTPDSGYFAVGSSTSNSGDVTGNHGAGDCWIYKLDRFGTLQWQKCLGGSQTDFGSDVIQTDDGGYIIVGGTYSNDGDVSGSHGNDDVWIVKIDSLGNIEWQNCYGGSENESGSSIKSTFDNGFIVAATTRSIDGDVTGLQGDSDYWIFKIDSIGNLLWQKCFGGSDLEIATDVIEVDDHGFIVAGMTESILNGTHGNAEGLIIKTDSVGNLVWQKCLGGSSYEELVSLSLTNDGGFIVGGHTESNDGDVMGCHGNGNAWIVKLTSAGVIEWQKCIGGSYGEFARSIFQTNDGGYIFSGISLSNDGDLTSNYGDFDYWVVKLSSATFISEEITESILMYPNPTSGKFTINIPEHISEASLKIINSLGEIIYTENNFINGKSYSPNLKSGIYYIIIEEKDFILRQKLIMN